MNKSHLIAITLSVFAASAFASEATPTPELDNFQSTAARAEVKAEIAKARAAGLLNMGEATVAPELESFRSQLSRAQVKAELAQYVRSGQRDRDSLDMYVGG